MGALGLVILHELRLRGGWAELGGIIGLRRGIVLLNRILKLVSLLS